MCDAVNGDVWFRSATMSEANDGRVATDEQFGIDGTTGGLGVQLPTSDGLPFATDGDPPGAHRDDLGVGSSRPTIHGTAHASCAATPTVHSCDSSQWEVAE